MQTLEFGAQFSHVGLQRGIFRVFLFAQIGHVRDLPRLVLNLLFQFFDAPVRIGLVAPELFALFLRVGEMDLSRFGAAPLIA